jgi:hypothetical protein
MIRLCCSRQTQPTNEGESASISFVGGPNSLHDGGTNDPSSFLYSLELALYYYVVDDNLCEKILDLGSLNLPTDRVNSIF